MMPPILYHDFWEKKIALQGSKDFDDLYFFDFVFPNGRNYLVKHLDRSGQSTTKCKHANAYSYIRNPQKNALKLLLKIYAAVIKTTSTSFFLPRVEWKANWKVLRPEFAGYASTNLSLRFNDRLFPTATGYELAIAPGLQAPLRISGH